MIVPLKSNQPALCAGPERQSKSLQERTETPGYSHTAGVFARTHMHRHAYTDAYGWEKVKRSTFVTLNEALF